MIRHMRTLIEPVTTHKDARGWVLEPIPPDAIGPQQNVHVALTEPGCVRGNHFHPRGTETAVVMGPALVRIRESGTIHDIIVPAGSPLRFIFPPGVSHAFQNTGQAPISIVAFNTEPHDPANPDLVRDILIEPAG
jgi:UDP-2-acetamido-2,6-beta-L-arabino-hexul-4-ose reductase